MWFGGQRGPPAKWQTIKPEDDGLFFFLATSRFAGVFPCVKPLAPHRYSMGKPHKRNPLESITKGFYWKASQKESFGKRNKGKRLESLTAGIRWKAPQRDHTGKPHKRNPRNAITLGKPLEKQTKKEKKPK